MKMKRFFIALAMLLAFCGCQKEDEPAGCQYTFKCDNTVDFGTLTLETVSLFEYDEAGDNINIQTIKSPEIDKVYSFVSEPTAVKVKVRNTVGKNGKSVNTWMSVIFTLSKTSKREIVLSGDSMSQLTEP